MPREGFYHGNALEAWRLSARGTDSKVNTLAVRLADELRLLANPAAFYERVSSVVGEELGVRHCRFIPAGGRDAASPTAAPGEICLPVNTVNEKTIGYLAGFPAQGGKRTAVAASRLERAAGLLAGPLEVALTIDSMREALSTNELTGLYTQRLFRRRLLEEVARAKRHGRTFAVGLLDVDRLALFNEMAGWAAGDEVLVNLANSLTTTLRASDFVARLGGDEFGVIMMETGRAGGALCLKRAISDFSGRCMLVHGQVYSVPGVTYGVGSYPSDGEDPVRMLAMATRRMVQRQTRVVGDSGSGRVIHLAPPQAD